MHKEEWHAQEGVVDVVSMHRKQHVVDMVRMLMLDTHCYVLQLALQV